jgi:outer membrane protein assembly factor BamD (BamD/ComL family)
MLQQGETRAALRRLSEAKVNYFPHREEVAKALFYMARAADKLGHSQQAVVFLKELKEYYPNSDWARRAD